ncbi:hypothetical protein F5Y04DRAFT_133297 [Hypomontagnella monticulosa]|nr:hypothetical protein F5Y04DRAFT_133297 [Hypomontagnella monticulosa]
MNMAKDPTMGATNLTAGGRSPSLAELDKTIPLVSFPVASLFPQRLRKLNVTNTHDSSGISCLFTMFATVFYFAEPLITYPKFAQHTYLYRQILYSVVCPIYSISGVIRVI